MIKQNNILFKIIKSLILITLLAPIMGFSIDNYDSREESQKKNIEILNVSYDPTREFFRQYNKEFVIYWKDKTGQNLLVKQSHGGSGKQARGVIDGLRADVITLALAYDIDVIAKKTQKFSEDWQTKLANNSSPYTSTIVFLVRKGNPKGIKDWDDLIKNDISVITPNPKTSGGARWNYLAAYTYALKKELGDIINVDKNSQKYKDADIKAKEFIKALFKNVPVLDSGARASTNTFVQRDIGDVLLAWENEAFLSINELGADKFEIVVPSISIVAEPPVTVVDENAKKHKTYDVSKAYLEYLYSPIGQKIAAKNFYRPYKPEFADKEDIAKFSKLELVTMEQVFGTWKDVQKKHFDDSGVFDSIYEYLK
jgi:sulfate transport system substrate-binding protein